jgi:hypothetical protein
MPLIISESAMLAEHPYASTHTFGLSVGLRPFSERIDSMSAGLSDLTTILRLCLFYWLKILALSQRAIA